LDFPILDDLMLRPRYGRSFCLEIVVDANGS